MGDDAKMAETSEILPVYQPNSQGAFNAYKVRAVPCSIYLSASLSDAR